MGTLPVSQFLTAFDTPVAGDQQNSGLPFAPTEMSGAAANAGLEVRLEAEYKRGLAEGKALAQAAHELELESLEGQEVQRLAQLRETWTSDEGAKLQALIGGAVQHVASGVADVVARILQPFVVDEVRLQAVDELASQIETALSDQDIARVEISGPADLLQRLHERIDGAGLDATYLANDACDVRLSFDKTLLETRLSAWLDHLAGSA